MRIAIPYLPSEPLEAFTGRLRGPFWFPGTGIAWITQSFRSMLAVLFACLPLVGCTSSLDIGLGKIPAYQYLQNELPQAFRLQAPARQVWQIVSEKAKMFAPCVLVEAPADRVLSWCEDAENWSDFGLNTVSFAGAPNTDPKKSMQSLISGKGIAITTVWIEDLGANCVLHVRKTYYGSQSFSGVGHSRGQDERLLYQHILYRLGMGGG